MDKLLDGLSSTITTPGNYMNHGLNLGAPNAQFLSMDHVPTVNSSTVSLWNWFNPEKASLDRINPSRFSLPEDVIYPIDIFPFSP